MAREVARGGGTAPRGGFGEDVPAPRDDWARGDAAGEGRRVDAAEVNARAPCRLTRA